ncbi:MAG: FAD-dependent oxidoreductase [Deltaproteobacteria bacterium]|nr:FAD-dependent oxidoreductase [Deltaproteobacteria bacterium]
MSPPHAPTEYPPILIPRSFTTTEGNKTGSWRFLRPRYDEKTAPCSVACPAGEDIGRIEMLVTQGLFKEAWETILLENPFPGVCGRVCHHPCEAVCNRHDFDEPIAIHVVERFLADMATRYDLRPKLPKLPPRPEKVAVVGAGPSGLAAAYFLTRLGYRCHVFEARNEPGGILRWGIPTYRLPEAVLKNEVVLLEAQGVEILCGKRMEMGFLEALRGEYAAVFLGCGHGRARPLVVPGSQLPGACTDGLQFLESIRLGFSPQLKGTVAVIGGGNTAVDVARSALRLGARPILIYRRRRGDMPAFPEEVEMALEEGVVLHELRTPVHIEPSPSGWSLTLQTMEPVGQPEGLPAEVRPIPGGVERMAVEKIFVAIGGEPADAFFAPPEVGAGTLKLGNCLLAWAGDGPPLVYGGDLTVEIQSVVHAVASGKEGAMALDVLFREGLEAVEPILASCRVGPGPALSMEVFLKGLRCRRNAHVVKYSEINTDHFTFAPRIAPPRLLREERIHGFAEIPLKISANLAMQEAGRCFHCGLCNQCDNCRLFCPEIAIHREETPRGRRIDYDYCKGCGICVVECPRNAMSLEEEEAS